MGAAEKLSAHLDAMANDLAITMFADWRHFLDRALEAVEVVARSGGHHFKTLVILVTANLAFSHWLELLQLC
jgi:hypothetical protein